MSRRSRRSSGRSAQYPHLGGPAAGPLSLLHGADLAARVSAAASIGLIHPETHFTDEKAGCSAPTTYRRLRRHWQFINELKLFEIHHQVTLRRARLRRRAREPDFLHGDLALSPRHGRAFAAITMGPGRSRVSRIQTATGTCARTRPDHQRDGRDAWRRGTPSRDRRRTRSTRLAMVYAVNRQSRQSLDKLSQAPRSAISGFEFSAGWHENERSNEGLLRDRSGARRTPGTT